MKLIEEMKKALPPHVPVRRVKAWADTLANSGALVPVRIENPNRDVAYDWYMTPTGLGWWGSDADSIRCVETPEGYHDAADCYPVRLVPIAEWEAER